jgi:hypothetical protein
VKLQLPWVSRRFADFLVQENERLHLMNEGLLRSAFSVRGMPDPFKTPEIREYKPIGRKRADDLIREMEEKERLVKPADVPAH